MVKLHTPSNFSVFITAGAGERFERDTNFVGSNGSGREKVVGDSRDSSACVRGQSSYVEHVRRLLE